MEIKVKNFTDEDVIPSSLAIIEGEITAGHSGCEIEENSHDQSIYVGTSGDVDGAQPWPVRKKRFKAVVQLMVGENKVCLRYRNCYRILKLTHQPVQSKHFVRLLYLIGSDDEHQGCIQGPIITEGTAGQVASDEYTAFAASQRIILGVKLIQAFIAESLHRHGLSRRTFKFETDAVTGEPACHVFRLRSLTTKEASCLPDHVLWKRVRDELAECEELPDKELCKFLGFASFTRYQNPGRVWPETHEQMLALTVGHAALGGGGLALLGTGCLHTWARDLMELVRCFTDCRKIDRMVLLDDSRYRETYWACYATTLGATCHELGHTFDLGHSSSGMMGGEFGDIHLAFVLPELIDEMMKASNVNDSFTHVQSKEATRNLRKDGHLNCSLRSFQGPSEIIARHEEFERIPCQVTNVRWKKSPTRDWELVDWSRDEAVWLSYHKWFNAPHSKNSGQGPQLYGLEIRARHSLRIVIVYVAQAESGERAPVLRRCWKFTCGIGRLTFRMNIEDLQPLQESDSLRVMAEDSLGNTMIKTLSLRNLLGVEVCQ